MVEFPPVTPFTSQVTLVFVVPEVVAVNCCWPASPRVATEGEIVIVTLGRVVLPPPHPGREPTTNAQKIAHSLPRTEIRSGSPTRGFAQCLRKLERSSDGAHSPRRRQTANMHLSKSVTVRNGTGPKGFGVSLGGRSPRTASSCPPPFSVPEARNAHSRRSEAVEKRESVTLAVENRKDSY
jgi:hypothetical protein